jgi:hypothetical protein
MDKAILRAAIEAQLRSHDVDEAMGDSRFRKIAESLTDAICEMDADEVEELHHIPGTYPAGAYLPREQEPHWLDCPSCHKQGSPVTDDCLTYVCGSCDYGYAPVQPDADA